MAVLVWLTLLGCLGLRVWGVGLEGLGFGEAGEGREAGKGRVTVGECAEQPRMRLPVFLWIFIMEPKYT